MALEGIALALRRRLIRRPFLHQADGAGGAALIGAVALGLAWIFGAVALHAPGTTQLRADVQDSVILRGLDDVLPPSGEVLDALDRVDPAPSITGPATPSEAARSEDRRRPRGRSARARSVVRVLSTACGLGIEGSGWAVRPNLVVTNAHVIAGADDTTVTTESGVELDATAVYYQPEDDLALLRVDARLPTLPISTERRVGAPAAVLGYPENGPYTVTPARIGETRDTLSEDSYGRGPIERTITALRRRRAQRQLGRAAARQPRTGGRGRLRGHHERADRRLRGALRGGRGRDPPRLRGRRRHGALHPLSRFPPAGDLRSVRSI